eukprot:gene5993-8251_t
MLRWNIKEDFVAGNKNKKCVHAHINGDFDHAKVLYMEPDWTYLDLLHAASQRLDMVPAAKKVFNADGVEIDDCMMIEDDDILFFSIVSDFINPPNLVLDNDTLATGMNNHRNEYDKLPSIAGGFRVGDMLGRGGFGEVRVGDHQLTGEKVALKFLKKSEIHSLGAAERTNTEIQCLQALKHTNIIRLQQHIESVNHVVLVFELMEGGDLLKYLIHQRSKHPLQKAALSEDEARHVFYQILSAMSYAHNQHICHRDLKLENILLKENSIALVKIADFGLSDFYRPGATMKSNCGTLSFLAPEVFRGTANAGPPLDIWAMGVILFAMLCGRLPFEGNDLTGNKRPRDAVIKSKIIKCQFKLDDTLGPEVKDLIRRLLQVDPSERASIPEIFNHIWTKSMNLSLNLSELTNNIINNNAHNYSNGHLLHKDSAFSNVTTHHNVNYSSHQNINNINGTISPSSSPFTPLLSRSQNNIDINNNFSPNKKVFQPSSVSDKLMSDIADLDSIDQLLTNNNGNNSNNNISIAVQNHNLTPLDPILEGNNNCNIESLDKGYLNRDGHNSSHNHNNIQNNNHYNQNETSLFILSDKHGHTLHKTALKSNYDQHNNHHLDELHIIGRSSSFNDVQISPLVNPSNNIILEQQGQALLSLRSHSHTVILRVSSSESLPTILEKELNNNNNNKNDWKISNTSPAVFKLVPLKKGPINKPVDDDLDDWLDFPTISAQVSHNKMNDNTNNELGHDNNILNNNNNELPKHQRNSSNSNNHMNHTHTTGSINSKKDSNIAVSAGKFFLGTSSSNFFAQTSKQDYKKPQTASSISSTTQSLVDTSFFDNMNNSSNNSSNVLSLSVDKKKSIYNNNNNFINNNSNNNNNKNNSNNNNNNNNNAGIVRQHRDRGVSMDHSYAPLSPSSPKNNRTSANNTPIRTRFRDS